jgi:peroxiredoxin
MIRRSTQVLGIWMLLACAGAGAKTAPSLEVRDINGVARRPLELGEAKAVVILFIAADCPIANGYAPEINRICAEYEPKHIAFFLVHGDPGLSEADARKHAREYGFTCPVVIDREHELVKRLGAMVTPEAAVVGVDGAILYRGRIDNLYLALGKKRFEATTHDLRAALDAVVAGREVPVPRTTAVGCAIAGK